MTPTVKAPSQVLIIGCGDIGRRVARLWLEQGRPVFGLARRPASAQAMVETGITPLTGDLDQPESLQKLPLDDSLLYYFAPPPPTGQHDPRMASFIAHMQQAGRPQRLVLISTSGVYGDHQGREIDETTPPNPQVDRARRRLDAETQLQAFAGEQAIPLITLRVGGIYGPGRLPIRRIREQVPLLHEALAPQTNRIHADDLARACFAAGQRGQAGAIYNISDGCDSNMTEYFNTIADFLGLPRPPTVDWAEAERRISKGMLSYLKESRRMNNRRMLDELGVRLKYPDLKSGLKSCGE